MSRREKQLPKGAYEVGYCKPPRHGQFKPGQSGNASGRPKGRPTLSELFLREASKLIAVKKGEDIVRISKAEGLVTKLAQMALQGDMAAMRLAVSILGQPQPGADGVGDDGAMDLGAIPDDEAVQRILSRFDHLRAEGSERR